MLPAFVYFLYRVYKRFRPARKNKKLEVKHNVS